MKATPNNDSPSANRAACKIGAFLRRTVSRQTAKAKRRQLLRSSNGEIVNQLLDCFSTTAVVLMVVQF